MQALSELKLFSDINWGVVPLQLTHTQKDTHTNTNTYPQFQTQKQIHTNTHTEMHTNKNAINNPKQKSTENKIVFVPENKEKENKFREMFVRLSVSQNSSEEEIARLTVERTYLQARYVMRHLLN